MLKVQIIRGVSVPFQFVLSAEKFCNGNFLDNGKFVGDIKILGEIANDSLKIVASGKIFCKKEFICDRCLNNASENQIIDFSEVFNPTDVLDDSVDITELIRDTLIASQPIQNLCKADCKGLCPICGKNLNDGVCNCNRFCVDPRLAPLLNFKSIEEV